MRGITLLETIVTVSLFTMIMLVMMSSILFFYRANDYSIEQSFAVAGGRSGMENLVQDLREASYADTGAYPLEMISANEIVFYSDIDEDNSVERVRYTIEEAVLTREMTKAVGSPESYPDDPDTSITVSENVRNIEQGIDMFSYFDADGEAIVDYGALGDVAFVRVSLVVNVNPERLPNEFLIRSSATLRNFSDDIE